jgi:uncharacterized SAM-binding protein YcdF (DUF218 family)
MGWFIFIGIGSLFILLVCFIASRTELDTKVASDMILVLGARIYTDQSYNPCLQARVRHAVDLYHAGYGKKLLFSGGKDTEDGVIEGEEMKKLAIAMGIPEQAILVENNATSTYENLLFGKAIIENNHAKTVIIVTEPFHMPRASWVADKLGVLHTVSPAIDSPCWTEGKFLTRYFWKEPFAVIGYMITRKL